MEDNSQKKSIIFIVCIILILLGALFIGWLDVFCFKSKTFVKKLTKNQYIAKSFEDFVSDLSTDGTRDFVIEINGGFLSLMGASVGDASNIELKNHLAFKNKDFDIDYQLSTDGTLIQSGELIRNKDVLAIAVPDLFDGFLAMNQENAEEVAQKLELIETKTDNQDYITNGKKILKKYLNLMMKQLNDEITTSKETISVHEKEYQTKVYCLEITDKKLFDVLYRISTELSNDEEAISFFADCIVISNRASSENKSKEEYVTLIKDKIDEFKNSFENEGVEFLNQNLIVVKLYSNNQATIRTSIVFGMNDSMMNASLDSVEGYASAKFQAKDSTLSFEYQSSQAEGKYQGELSAISSIINVPLLSFHVLENDKEPQLKKINDLNARFINRMNDEELEALKEELQTNLNSYGGDYYNMAPFEKGEFKLQNEDKRMTVLPQAIELYKKITPGVTLEEAETILGKADNTFDYDPYLYLSWYISPDMNYPLISVMVKDNKVTSVYIDVYSSMLDNVQISKELETDIEDLTERASKITEEMTKAEVIAIMGNQYYEELKDDSGLIGLKWYDKNENAIAIEFDENEKLWNIGMIEKGGF